MEGGGGWGAKDEDEDEEHHRNPFLSNSVNKPSPSKHQFRSEVSKALWVEEMGMGEIVEKKGSLWSTTGVAKTNKLYCHIEEILFLAEKGALILTSPNDKKLSVGDIYEKVIGAKFGCSWESFQAYKHLKSLGYIIQRCDTSWTSKNDRISCSFNSSTYKNKGTYDGLDLISDLLEGMRINNLKPLYNVYLPNSKFRKSSPGDPDFLLCLLRDNPPSISELENLEEECDGFRLKYCYVNNGRASFFSMEKGSIPTLP
ncbi:uncharacterized protein LOC121970713 [Zingiber officinale]|uniref:tRNA-splicing endonuclease subunit Sen54 N-terminal domain-containing protein n=1 Tax=Zingiber officinale TaxID=94328 RepID=A0A8J5H1X3_ZINOF|nr:uncharacterized protein LOC121970713 [Zingiber officinale]KAG6515106.1 hypothetical protein ZIOFF_025491 [Zingiber officinale]